MLAWPAFHFVCFRSAVTATGLTRHFPGRHISGSSVTRVCAWLYLLVLVFHIGRRVVAVPYIFAARSFDHVCFSFAGEKLCASSSLHRHYTGDVRSCVSCSVRPLLTVEDSRASFVACRHSQCFPVEPAFSQNDHRCRLASSA